MAFPIALLFYPMNEVVVYLLLIVEVGSTMMGFGLEAAVFLLEVDAWSELDVVARMMFVTAMVLGATVSVATFSSSVAQFWSFSHV